MQACKPLASFSRSWWNLSRAYVKIREIHAHTGAGYLVALAGKMMLMPGLPENPMLENMDLTDDGQARGLF